MKQLLIYFQLEWKKCLKSFPGIFTGTVFIGVLLLGITFLWQMHQAEKTQSQIIQIGIVAEKEEPYLDWIINAVEQMESTRYTCHFSRIEEEDATKTLRSGKLNAVFIIPSNYIDSLIRGNNQPIIIRFGTGQPTITNFLIRQFGDAFSRFMIDTQAGIYAMNDYYRQNHLPNRQKDELVLNIAYLNQILKRNHMLQIEEIEAENDLSYGEYYFSSGLILFLLCWGLTCPGIFLPECPALKEKLCISGIGHAKQTLIRHLVFLLIFSCNYLLFSCFFSFGISWSGSSIPGIDDYSSLQWLLCFLRILPILPLVCTIIQLAYEIARDKIGSILFLFLLILTMGYLSGCFYPLSYLPAAIRKPAPFLPVRVMFSYISNCITGNWSLLALVKVFFYHILLLGIITIISAGKEKWNEKISYLVSVIK